MAKKTLLPEVAEHYQLKGLEVGKHEINGFGTVDFEEMNLPEADAYFALKMPFLIQKKKSTPSVEKP